MYETVVEQSSLYDVPASRILPPGFSEIAPGAELALVLSGINSRSLSRFERVGVITAWRRMVSHCQAAYYREIAALYEQELAENPEALVEDSAWAVRTELGAALHLPNRGAELEFERALFLARAPGVQKALSEGALDLYRAQVLVNSTCHLPDQDVSWVIGQVIEEAEVLTASQLRVRVQRLCYLANPEEARLRYGEAVKNRFVSVRGNEFGTATLEGSDLPPDRAEAAYKRLTRLAREKAEEEGRGTEHGPAPGRSPPRALVGRGRRRCLRPGNGRSPGRLRDPFWALRGSRGAHGVGTGDLRPG
ncbi:MAG TPA: DUF222 domain-containing protein, partial [Acidimicrobiia bacterium]|nr:DUF222 domain-containing protein [Acidimicrobiia bacterium]